MDRAGNGEGVRHDFPIFAGEIPLPQDSTKFLVGRDSVEPSDKNNRLYGASAYRRKREKIRLSTMLIMMQVTIGE